MIEFIERLGESDLATLREEQFRAAALAAARSQADRKPAPGRCANCGEVILPQAYYCDADCRDDHETREAILRRKAGR